MNAHERTLHLAAAALDFPLAADERRELERHLTACPSCRRAAGELRIDAVAVARLAEAGRPSERVLRRVVDETTPRRRPWSRGRALAAGVASVAMAGVAVLVGAGQVARPAPGPAAIDWTRVADATPFAPRAGRSSIAALTDVPGTDGYRLFAAGIDAEGARLWLSRDAAAWEAVVAGPLDRARVKAVAATGDRLIAVGSIVDDQGGSSGMVWTSVGHSGWHAIPIAGTDDLLAVAAGPGFLVVAGIASPGDTGAIRHSDDGVTWSPVADPAVFGQANVTGLVLGGPGFVAVGYDDLGGIVWTSTDGLGWQRRSGDHAFARSPIRSIASTPAGLVAVGSSAEGAVTWRSVDGIAWERIGLESRPGQGATAVVATAAGILAVGGSSAGPEVWGSTDGAAWRAMPGRWTGATELHAVAGYGGLVVAGGALDGHATLWLGSPD